MADLVLGLGECVILYVLGSTGMRSVRLCAAALASGGARPKALPPRLDEGRVARTSGGRATRRGQNDGLYPWLCAVGKGSIASWVTPRELLAVAGDAAVRTSP